MHYYDLWHGVELTPDIVGGKAKLRFSVEGLGFGAVLATSESAPSGELKNLLAFMAERGKRPSQQFHARMEILAAEDG